MNGPIRTSSVLKMLYLRGLCKYRLIFKCKRPLLIIGGILIYETYWVLAAA